MTTQVSVPGAGLNLPISDLRIGGDRVADIILTGVTAAGALGKHDSARVSARIPSTVVSTLERQPISFRIGSSPAYTFQGRIYTTEKGQKLQAQVECVLTCIGVTSAAKSPVTGLLEDVTAEGVADVVLPQFGLGYYSTGSTAKFPRFALTGRNGWEALRDALALTGREMASVNGGLWFFDPLTELDRGTPAAQFRKSQDTFGSGDRKLLDFVPGSARPKVSNEDLPRAAWFAPDGSLRTEAPSGDNTYWANDLYLPDGDFAKAVFATARKKFVLGQTATARVMGSPGIFSGMTIDISTGVTGLVTDTYDGLWLVIGVDHEVLNGVFQSKLTLVRDKYRRANNKTYEPFWLRSNRPFPTLSLSGDRWISTWSKKK
jgi:hypothetical protein